MANPQRDSDEAATTASNESAESADYDGYVGGFNRTQAPSRESFGRAFISIIVFTAAFGAALFYYWKGVQTSEEVRELASDGKAEFLKDDPRSVAKAKKLFGDALAMDPDEPYVVSTMALLSAQQVVDGAVQSAAADAKKYLDVARAKKVRKQERFGAEGLVRVIDGKYAEAETYMVEEVINQGGVGPAIWGALGLAQRSQGKLGDARQSLRKAADGEWRNPRYPVWISQVYLEESELKNASSFAKKALDANSDHPAALVQSARVAIAREKISPEDKAQLDDVLGRSEDAVYPRTRALALTAYAEFHLYNKEWDEALAKADEALTVLPLYEAHLARGLALAGAKKEGAYEAFSAAFELFPFSPRAYHKAAQSLLDAGNAEKALEIMNMWGEKVAKDAPYHVAYGVLHLDNGDTEAAVTEFNKALELDRGYAEAYYHLGKLDADAKKYDEAIDFFNKAIEAKEHYPEVYEAMGFIYLDQGHFPDALKLISQEALPRYKAQRRERKFMMDVIDRVYDALMKKKQKATAKAWKDEAPSLIE